MSVHEGKRIQDMTIIERLRNALQPKGTAPIVILRPLGIGIEMHSDFVSKCIDELEQMVMLAHVGIQEPSNLEKLAYQLLLDSAYIDPKHEAERERRLQESWAANPDRSGGQFTQEEVDRHTNW